MDAIKTQDLTKSFSNLTAVNNLSFTVDKGEIFGLVGPDGAGKTTTMRLLTSIMEPSSGDAWISGKHITKDAESIKEDIGYMSQRFGLYSDLSVIENINFYADIYSVPRKNRDSKVEELLEFSNLTQFRKRLAGNLSGGMKQKLGLVCALIHTPRVLFLDEPTNGVDPVSRRDFWGILYQLLRQKVTIFVSTAYMDEAERCTRVGLIHKGKILNIGTPGKIKLLMRGEIIEIRTSNPRDTVHLLREELDPDSVGLFGDKVHVVTTEPETATKETKNILKKAGVEIVSINIIEPSLEDVFISVLASQRQEEQEDE